MALSSLAIVPDSGIGASREMRVGPDFISPKPAHPAFGLRR